MINREKILELAKPVLDEKRFFIVSFSISNTNKISMHLDSMDGVKIGDCVEVSRAIEHGLNRDEEDFELEVSSAGLDAPFTVREQYEKNLGRTVSVYHSDGTKKEGKLMEVNETDFIVEYRRRERMEGKKKKQLVVENRKYNYNEVSKIKLVISF